MKRAQMELRGGGGQGARPSGQLPGAVRTPITPGLRSCPGPTRPPAPLPRAPLSDRGLLPSGMGLQYGRAPRTHCPAAHSQHHAAEVVGGEGGLARHHLVHHAAQRPHVALEAVWLLLVDLRRPATSQPHMHTQDQCLRISAEGGRGPAAAVPVRRFPTRTLHREPGLCWLALVQSCPADSWLVAHIKLTKTVRTAPASSYHSPNGQVERHLTCLTCSRACRWAFAPSRRFAAAAWQARSHPGAPCRR
jgi:hypothetical protein